MPRNARCLTVPEAVLIMQAALGDPPTPPPGCVRLLLGCWQVLSDEWYEVADAMFETHHDLFQLWMRFLVVPRSPLEFKTLFAVMETCRCQNRPALVRNAPRDLHIHFQGPDHAVARFATMLCREFAPRLEKRWDITRLYRTRDRTAWPRSLEDMLPYEPNNALHMLGTWIDSPGHTPTAAIGRLFRVLVETFKARVLFGLIKSPTTWHWLTRTVFSVASRLKDKYMPVTPLTVGNLLYFLSETGGLLDAMVDTMFAPEILMWVEHGCGMKRIQGVVNLCVAALQIIPVALAAIPETEHTEDMAEFACVAEEAWSALTIRLMWAQPETVREDIVGVRALDLCLSEEVVDWHDPHTKFIRTACGPQWTQRCYAPECLETYAGAERKFRGCNECKTATYCSRKCQKTAWNHPTAPHCGLMCALLRRVHILRGQHYEPARVRAKFRQVIPIGAADAGNTNVANLIQIKSAYLGA
jgi:hypothetical protein